ncbi:MAG: hypothetical protein HUJ80_09595 [Firmicutes bacterium]|nr:hypothetical protein [Bacillota bacterium]
MDVAVNYDEKLGKEYIMDIYSWINSKDIAEHNRKLGHEFNAMEAAFLVWQNEDRTLEERFAAWEDIIETVPDMAVEECPWLDRIESTHGFIRDYTELLKRTLKEFYDISDRAVWTRKTLFCDSWYSGDPEFIEDGGIYVNPDICLKAARERENSYIENVTVFRIGKKYIEDEVSEYGRKGIVIDFNRDGVPVRIIEPYYTEEKDKQQELFNSFEGMWLDVPVPFKEGDILHSKCRYSPLKPFVLKYTMNQPGGKHTKEWIDDHVNRWDISDMGCCGYWVREDGTIFGENLGYYLNAEYYREELRDNEQILYWLSKYLKKQIPLDEFLLIQEKIRLDALRNDISYADRLMEAYRDNVDLAGKAVERKYKSRLNDEAAMTEDVRKLIQRFLPHKLGAFKSIYGLEAEALIDEIWQMSESCEDADAVHRELTCWEIENDAYLGWELFQSKIDLHFDDPDKQKALYAYLHYPLDGGVDWMRKGIDGFITTGAAYPRKHDVPYKILVLEDTDGDILMVGARLAAGSPRVYVDYRNGDSFQIIRVSIDPENPQILEGDEKDCPGADFTKIFEFIKTCYRPLMDHWEGKIDTSEMWDGIKFCLTGTHSAFKSHKKRHVKAPDPLKNGIGTIIL